MQKAVYQITQLQQQRIYKCVFWPFFTSSTAFCTVKSPLLHTRFLSYHLFNCLPVSPSLRPFPYFCACGSSSPFPVFCLPSICLICIPSLLLSFPSSTKSSGHQSYVVSGTSEVHSLLHLAQLPLADPQGLGADTAAAHAGPLPLLNPWLPSEEDAWGLMRW